MYSPCASLKMFFFLQDRRSASQKATFAQQKVHSLLCGSHECASRCEAKTSAADCRASDNNGFRKSPILAESETNVRAEKHIHRRMIRIEKHFLFPRRDNGSFPEATCAQTEAARTMLFRHQINRCRGELSLPVDDLEPPLVDPHPNVPGVQPAVVVHCFSPASHAHNSFTI